MTGGSHGGAARPQFSRERVLVLGHGGPSLAAIRSLSAAGFRVLVGRDTTSLDVDCSRHASELSEHPSPDTDGRKFVDWLLDFLQRRRDVAFVFPIGERYLSCLACHAGEFSDSPHLVMPAPAAIMTCLDKRASYELASRLDVPVPERRLVGELSKLEAAATEVGYPCVVKPVDSLRPFLGRKAIIFDTPRELRTGLTSWPDGHSVLLVEEYVRGYRHNCQFAALDGEVTAYFEHRSRRTDRIDGTGNEVEGESIAPTAALREYTQRMMRALGYSGVGCVQFVLEPRSGRAGFMEINPRLDGMCEIARGCGYDFPMLAIECARGRAPMPPARGGAYPPGKRIHWLMADVQGLIGAVGRREVSLSAALWWTARMAEAFVRSDFQLAWAWTDPLPTLQQYGRFARTLCTRAAALVLPHEPPIR